MAGKKIEQARKAAQVRPEQPPRRRPVQHRRLRRPRRELQARAPALRLGHPRRRRPVRRQHPRGGKHEHRRRPEDGPGDDPGRVAAELRPLPHRRPADGGRDARAVDRRELPRRPTSAASRVFCFGVGYDVNARLLDRLSGGNSGTSEYVKPDEDIEAHVGAVLLQDDQPGARRTSGSSWRASTSTGPIPATSPTCSKAARSSGPAAIASRARRRSASRGKVGGERRSRSSSPPSWPASYRGPSHDFVERLWASAGVGDLIDQIDLHGQNKELIDELVALSTKYGILTPYTSFLADERVQLHARRGERQSDPRSLSIRSSKVDGQVGCRPKGFQAELTCKPTRRGCAAAGLVAHVRHRSARSALGHGHRRQRRRASWADGPTAV